MKMEKWEKNKKATLETVRDLIRDYRDEVKEEHRRAEYFRGNIRNQLDNHKNNGTDLDAYAYSEEVRYYTEARTRQTERSEFIEVLEFLSRKLKEQK